MTNIDPYNPSAALSGYYPSRDERRPARLWAREKTLADLQDFGAVSYFQGGGSDPTSLSGYATSKLWLRLDPGVTDAPGEVRYYAGGTASSLSSWPVLTREGFVAHLGLKAGGEFDYAWSASTSGDPGTGKVLANNATLASATSLNISKTGRQGQSYATRINTWRAGDIVRISGVSAETSYIDVLLSGAPTDNSTYFTVTFSVRASSSIAAGQLLGIQHIPTALSNVANPVTIETVTNQYGEGRTRGLAGTLARWSSDYMGQSGPGGTTYFPRSITASQSGTTVTASTSVFDKIYVGALIRWGTGEEAVILSVDNSGSGYAAITTCTVDRSQTVSSGAATIVAKHVVGVTYGDSLGNRLAPILEKTLWRGLGFGGYIIQAGSVEDNQGGQIVTAATTGTLISGSGYSTTPWGAYWEIDSAETLTVALQQTYSLGVARPLRHGLSETARAHDTFLLVWRRGTGAITIDRRRFHDDAWENVVSSYDTSTGSRAFNYYRTTHTLGSNWQYRVTGVSGTVKIVSAAFFNNSVPGYVHWPLSRGGDNITSFAGLSSGDLAELCQLHMQPDFRWIMSADGTPGDTDASDYTAGLLADRSLWGTAAPRCDHFWAQIWESSEVGPNEARNDAILATALAYKDTYVPLYDLFGDWATGSSLRGWVQDTVHPTIPGEVIAGHQMMRVLGLLEHPTIRQGRDVGARLVKADTLSLDGVDLGGLLAEARKSRDAGCKWQSGSMRLEGASALSAAIGTSDFTLSLDMDVIANVSGGVQYLAIIATDTADTSAVGSLVLYREGADLKLQLRGNPNTDITTYVWSYLGTALSGQRGILTLRSHRAKSRFDLFFDGKPLVSVTGSASSSGSGASIGSWSGAGTNFAITQGSASGRSSYVYGAAFWLSRLSDAEVLSNVAAVLPATTPEFLWCLDQGMGRIVPDRSGNRKQGLFRVGSVDTYNLTTAPTWKVPKSGGLAAPWTATADVTTALLPGDDVVAKYTSTRDMTLPATPQLGDEIRVTKATSSTVRFAQPALHQIKSGAGSTVGTDASTIGTSGKLTIATANGSAHLKCTRAEAGTAYEWAVIASAGTLTWT